MAETAAVVASVVAIVGAGKAVFKIAKLLRRAAKDAASSKSDLEMVALTMEVFSNALSMSKLLIRELAPKLRGKSRIIDFIMRNCVMETLETSAGMLKRRLSPFQRKIRKLMKKIQLGARLGWLKWHYFDKFDFDFLNSQMLAIKTGMELFLTSLQLTHAVCSPETEENKAEIQKLKNLISIQIKNARRADEVRSLLVQKEVETLRVREETGIHLRSQPSSPPSLNGLLELAESVRDHHRLPNGIHVSASEPATPVAMRRKPIRHEKQPPVVPFIPKSTSKNSRRRNSTKSTGPPAPRLRRRSGNSSIRIPTLPDETAVKDAPRVSPPPPRVVETTTPDSPPSPRVGTGPVTPVSPKLPEQATSSSVAPRESSYISVRPRATVLRVARRLHSLKRREGHMIPRGTTIQHKVSGLLDPDLEECILSTALAERLGAEVEPCELGDPTTVKLERDSVIDMNIRGSTEMTWVGMADDEGELGRFGLKFWVYQSHEEGLILGEPFVRKRRHYRNQRPTAT